MKELWLKCRGSNQTFCDWVGLSVKRGFLILVAMMTATRTTLMPHTFPYHMGVTHRLLSSSFLGL